MILKFIELKYMFRQAQHDYVRCQSEHVEDFGWIIKNLDHYSIL